LRLQLATVLDNSEKLLAACTALEGDGYLIFNLYDKIELLRVSLIANKIVGPNCKAILREINPDFHQEYSHRIWNWSKPVVEYLQTKVTKYSKSLNISKVLKIFRPWLVKLIKERFKIGSLECIKWIKPQQIKLLTEEFPKYVILSKDVPEDIDLMLFLENYVK